MTHRTMGIALAGMLASAPSIAADASHWQIVCDTLRQDRARHISPHTAITVALVHHQTGEVEFFRCNAVTEQRTVVEVVLDSD